MAIHNAFHNKSALVTGHTGFKGSWLVAWLRSLGARVTGISLDPPTSPSHFAAARLCDGIVDYRIDIRDQSTLRDAVVEVQPDIVFHLAAQSLVRRSYLDPLETWHTNVVGTLNVLEALRAVNKPCSAVLITSDKCYDNVEWVWGYRETDALGGPDPYSASKAGAELAIRSYVKSFFPKATSNIRIGVARAGNVIGGGDWAADRIVPDCVKAWSNNKAVELRRPNSTRPWQHVLEPLSGYLTLAVALIEQPDLHGEPFNFGPSAQQNQSVLALVQKMSAHWDQVRWLDVSESDVGPYESGQLKLNCDKTLNLLNWYAVMGFDDTVQMTTQWYRMYYQRPEQIKLTTLKQIADYSEMARNKGLPWAQ